MKTKNIRGHGVIRISFWNFFGWLSQCVSAGKHSAPPILCQFILRQLSESIFRSILLFAALTPAFKRHVHICMRKSLIRKDQNVKEPLYLLFNIDIEKTKETSIPLIRKKIKNDLSSRYLEEVDSESIFSSFFSAMESIFTEQARRWEEYDLQTLNDLLKAIMQALLHTGTSPQKMSKGASKKVAKTFYT